MLSLVRKSSKYLVIETHDINAIENYFTNNLHAYKSNICTVSSKTNEDYTIIYITDDINKNFKLDKEALVYMLPNDSDQILCKIFNDEKNYLIKSLRVAPRLIIFRYFGSLEKIIYSMLKDYEGQLINIDEAVFNLKLKGSIISFTDKPLSRSLAIDDLYSKCIIVEKPIKDIYRNLKLNLLRYLNEGLDNKNWYELDIKIYDIYSDYHMHYRRLIHVLDNLELGFVLGENWSKDYAVLLMKVPVYSIKFFTLYEPKYIKKILMGLEVSSSNKRICDFDIYYGRKKISWTEFAQNKKETRIDVASRCRKELMGMLSPFSIEYLSKIEEQIEKNTK